MGVQEGADSRADSGDDEAGMQAWMGEWGDGQGWMGCDRPSLRTYCRDEGMEKPEDRSKEKGSVEQLRQP